MPARRFGLIAAVPLLALAGHPASAQQQPRFGPPVTGVCLFARKDALETSRPGQIITQRVANAQQAVQRQIDADRARIEAQIANLKPAETSRRMALFEQMNTLSRYESDAQARIQQQTQTAYRGVEPVMEAALAQVVTRRGCALIVERSITYGWNSAMDITAQVIGIMNAPPQS